MQAFWSFVASVYMFPIEMWKDGNYYDSWPYYIGAGFMFALIWGGSAAIVYFAALGIRNRYRWYTKREHCQHCGTWTIGTADAEYDDCDRKQACCWPCIYMHRAKSEDTYQCPADGNTMRKVINELGIIIDECTDCGGVWMTRAERDAIISNAEDDAAATGMLTGLAIGIST